MVDNPTNGAPGTPQTARPAGSGDDPSSLSGELARARDRLAFYESFDALIQENIRRSGELLRQMAEEREQSQLRLEALRAEVDGRLVEQRTMLAEIATSLGDLEQNLGAITSRVNASLSRLSVSTAPLEPQELETDNAASPAPIEERAGSLEVVQATVPRAVQLEPKAAVAFLEPPSGIAIPASALGASDASISPLEDRIVEQLDAQGLAGDATPETQPAPGPRRIDLVIHGVPKAATALAIQRHLQDLPAVQAVEVREYVSGVLRFQVTAQDLAAIDLASWEGGDGLEALTSTGNVLEVRLPAAEGL